MILYRYSSTFKCETHLHYLSFSRCFTSDYKTTFHIFLQYKKNVSLTKTEITELVSESIIMSLKVALAQYETHINFIFNNHHVETVELFGTPKCNIAVVELLEPKLKEAAIKANLLIPRKDFNRLVKNSLIQASQIVTERNKIKFLAGLSIVHFYLTRETMSELTFSTLSHDHILGNGLEILIKQVLSFKNIELTSCPSSTAAIFNPVISFFYELQKDEPTFLIDFGNNEEYKKMLKHSFKNMLSSKVLLKILGERSNNYSKRSHLACNVSPKGNTSDIFLVTLSIFLQLNDEIHDNFLYECLVEITQQFVSTIEELKRMVSRNADGEIQIKDCIQRIKSLHSDLKALYNQIEEEFLDDRQLTEDLNTAINMWKSVVDSYLLEIVL